MIPISDTTVLVGRFQVDHLHNGHIDLIRSVIGAGDSTIVCLGVAPFPSKENPLGFRARAQMIREWFPEVVVVPLPDVPGDDAAWSALLDQRLAEVAPSNSFVLYGGRDSFVRHYSGRHQALELHDPAYNAEGLSGSAVRERIRKTVLPTRHFRAGIIHHAMNQYDRVFPTVDVAVLRRKAGKVATDGWSDRDPYRREVLLIRKADEKDWRLPGGFVDPADASYADAAWRELAEETGVAASDFKRVGEFRVADPRFSRRDSVMTTLFTVGIDAEPTAADDAAEVAWVPVGEAAGRLAPFHRPLLEAALSSLS